MDLSDILPVSVNFSEEEGKVLEYWNRIEAFENSLKQSKNNPRYTFYDGPPFATGLPHYGHLLAGTVKDIVTRYAHQNGFHVDRKFGWDCHGLPVEYEIDKQLGISGPDDVEKMGIKAYNDCCRGIVMRYSSEWEFTVKRMGRWIDFKNDYKTMYLGFMESVWWVFKQLYNKGLVYRGVKVMPFSTACLTPLSNFEAGLNYQDVVDPAVIVSFPLIDEPEVNLTAWTTTPWTLPSNLAICVNADMEYSQIKDNQTSKIYIIMTARLSSVYKKEEDYTVMKKMIGKELAGKRYQPLFDYFIHLKDQGFRVLCDNYVSADSGTGLVHQAPYFGEDDYRVCLANEVITKDMDMICPVDSTGKFDSKVTHFTGLYVKDADKQIIKYLKEKNRLVQNGTINHNYPFCWRSDTPLLYKAVPTWFIRVENIVDKLLENNSKTYWVPDFVKEKRFANWLRDARDWAVSRNRFWGTPMPLWVSDDMEEVVCIGSVEDLERLSGKKVTDLHRENVDHITIPSRTGRGVLKRVTEVFDCWFESGSMPYAQVHYPFENQREFEDAFPADFIAEGIDQTRGWFYTLMVLSTALFDKPPFKNLIVHGHVLASDGQKMSKRKKNYPDPLTVIEKYGADALRLYLINSPVVRGSSLRFKEEGVHDVVKDFFLPWYNATRFLIHAAIDRYQAEVLASGEKLTFSVDASPQSDNVMDRWILSFTQSLIKHVRQEMSAYRLYTVLPDLVKFVDQLTNWYVRMNRNRLKGKTISQADCFNAMHTLFFVLYKMTVIMAPFVPFITEVVYQRLRLFLPDSQPAECVHYLMMPEVNESVINSGVEQAVSHMQAAIELGRVIRDRVSLPLKYPLNEVVLVHRDETVLQSLQPLQHYIQEELNVRAVTLTSDKAAYGVELSAQPDHKRLGTRLKDVYKKIMQELKTTSTEKLESFLQSGSIELCGETLTSEDLQVVYVARQNKEKTAQPNGVEESSAAKKKGKKSDSTANKAKTNDSVSQSDDGPKYEAHSDSRGLLVLLNISLTQSQIDEGLAREIVNRIQKLRKKALLQPENAIEVYYTTKSKDLLRIIKEYNDLIMETVKQPMIEGSPGPKSKLIEQETCKIKSDVFNLWLTKPSNQGGLEPVCPFVDVELCVGGKSGDAKSRRGTILLENPVGEHQLSLQDLEKHARIIFSDINEAPCQLELYLDCQKSQPISPSTVKNVLDLHGSTLYAFVKQ